MSIVVLKFGGTSVATAAGWQTIAARIAACRAAGETPVVVHSALAGISNRLEATLRDAVRDEHAAHLEAIAAQHAALGSDLGLDGRALIDAELALLTKLTAGIALIGEVSPKQHARVVAQGELMATRLGHAWLAARGLDIASVDARRVLTSVPHRDGDAADHYLNADCDFSPSDSARAAFSGHDAYLTQGFIAQDPDGETVLLGRGGSDTSASYLAAMLGADRIEIWTDVAGMYSADPRLVPGARILKKLDYAEAQEIASTGARVLHPKCLRPARVHGIPLRVLSTAEPDAPGTLVSAQPGSTDARLKAVSARKGITLVSMETSGMWQEAGFLARAFAVFARRQLSIDLISSSETSVTVSLDAPPAKLAAGPLDKLVDELGEFCRVSVIQRCAAISLVGRQVRAILHEVAPAFDVFKEFDIYLVSQAANDLNFTFVVDEDHSDKLVQRLHDLLIRRGTEADPVMGEAYAQRHAPPPAPAGDDAPWWLRRRDELLDLAPADAPLWVYDRATVSASARALVSLDAVGRVLYSMKANGNADLLRHLDSEGVHFECVSVHELRHLFETLPALPAASVLFTPNFAGRSEYAEALARGVQVTIDNLWVLERWGDLFAGREILLRVDPGQGKGHHRYVLTAGKQSKFGIPLDEVGACAQLARACGARIVGLHAHKGSGIVEAGTWANTARTLARAAKTLDDVRVLNLGGGLGVPDTRADPALDVAALGAQLHEVHTGLPYELWLEPGRYLSAQAGVLLARVTQCKDKDGVRYVGVNTGMNSLIRPALYGAHHEIVNLTRYGETPDTLVDVVGPICESADVLGNARMLPRCSEGDVLAITNAGAYGRVMSSHYNLRPPGEEVLI